MEGLPFVELCLRQVIGITMLNTAWALFPNGLSTMEDHLFQLEFRKVVCLVWITISVPTKLCLQLVWLGQVLILLQFLVR
jgi:hypothetical protein